MLGSVAMMMEMSFNMGAEAANLWKAMQSVFSDGFTTPDLARRGDAEKQISTSEFGDRVVAALAAMPAAG